jgi:hypothetical protein
MCARDIVADFEAISKIFGASPTLTIRNIEQAFPKLGPGAAPTSKFLTSEGISLSAYQSALNAKRALGQINVVIHALGILIALPHILEPDETVKSVALGAGNTGRDFDLLTDRRVAEFKFITWRGGPESIRQNSVFADFLKLLWWPHKTTRQLFLTGTTEALRFLNGRRALSSVLSKNVTTKAAFDRRYIDRYQNVGQFYGDHRHLVEIVDLFALVPELQSVDLPTVDAEA